MVLSPDGKWLAAPLTGRDGTRLGVIYLCDRGDVSFDELGDDCLAPAITDGVGDQEREERKNKEPGE